MTRGIPGLKPDLKKWVKKNDLPVNYNYLLNIARIDQIKYDEQAEMRQERDELSSHNAIAKREKEHAEMLQRLCKRFGVEQDSTGKMSDTMLFKQLLLQDSKSFFTFKYSSSVERTLVKNNLKPKKESCVVRKAKEAIRQTE